jgi:ribonuclease HII
MKEALFLCFFLARFTWQGEGMDNEKKITSDGPSLEWEKLCGFPRVQVAGVDEVGRGCLAGPVVSAAVLFPIEWGEVPLSELITRYPILGEVRDSKVLTPKKRERISGWLKENVAAYSIGEATREEIDRVNILNATHLSMVRAIDGVMNLRLQLIQDGRIMPSIESILIDGNRAPRALNGKFVVKTLIKGDSLSLSIACASIIAKVHRDSHLLMLGKLYPNHRFEVHKGYGTKVHLQAIADFGVTPEHRRSFAPVRNHLRRIDSKPSVTGES